MHSREAIYVIYYKDNCPFCDRARETLRRICHEDNLCEIHATPSIQIALTNSLGQTTVPYIFCDGKFVGGAADLDEHVKNHP